MEGFQHLGAVGIRINLDVITRAVGRHDGANPPRRDPLLGHHLVKHLARIFVEFRRLLADHLVFENRGETSAQFPRMEKGRPVDVIDQLLERKIIENFHPSEARCVDLFLRPIRSKPPLPRLVDFDQFGVPLLGRKFDPQALVVGGQVGREFRSRLRVEQLRNDPDHPRGIGHMNHFFVVIRGDLYRAVRAARRRASNEEREVESFALHLGRDVHHFVERGGDQTGQADHVHPVGAGLGEDLFAGDHDPEVDHLVAVAGQDDANDVFADVVDIAFDRGHEDFALGAGIRVGRALALHVRGEPGDGALHHARTLDHLREEHFPLAE